MGITIVGNFFAKTQSRLILSLQTCENSMQWQSHGALQAVFREGYREGYCNPFTLVHLSNLILLSLNTSDQIVDTLSLNQVYSFRDQNNPHPSKLGCLMFSTSSLNSGTTLHGGYGEGKALFFSFEVSKMSERSFREKCLN